MTPAQDDYANLMLSVDDQRPPDPCPDDFNLAWYVLFENGAPDEKIALSLLSHSGAERWNYGLLRATVQDLAASLIAHGLGPGDELLLRLGHSPLFPVAFLAAVWVGIIPVPTSVLLTENEISGLARVLRPDAVLADDTARLPIHEAPVLRLADLTTSGERAPPVLGSPDRVAYILCTSGTGGEPRLVTHAHRAIWARRSMRAGWTGMTRSDRVLHAGAMNWSYTLGIGLFDPWSMGATALGLSEHTDVSAIPLLANRHDVTILAAVPGVFRRLLREAIPPLPKLRHALSAGEKLPEATRASWREAVGTDIHEAFGQTECSTFLSGNPARPAPADSLGYAQPGRAVAIISEGQPVVRGEIGEIAVSRDDPGLGLLPEIADAAWVGTGDLGSMAEDGSITYHGRIDDILTAGGCRISPIEVERAYEEMPDIELAAAVDHQLAPGTTVVALYYVAPEPVADAQLLAHGKLRLASYKLPRLFFHRTGLPLGRNGKLLRRALRTEKDTAP